jgi:intracellular septation protein
MKKETLLKTIEIFSMLGFFGAYELYDLRTATLVLMGFMALLLLVAKVFKAPLGKVQKGTAVVVIVLGVLSLVFQDDRFIQWKSTIVNGTISLVLLLSHFIGNETVLERIIADKFPAQRGMMRRVNASAVVHLAIIATLNLYVAYSFSEQVWMNFKIFGISLLNIVFVSGAMFYMREPLKSYLDSIEKK